MILHSLSLGMELIIILKILYYSSLWNILPYEVVQCVDLKHFKAALKIYLDFLVRAHIHLQHLLIFSWLLRVNGQ